MELTVPADKLNTAIEEHYPYTWSDDVSRAFLNALGADGLALVEEIRRFSNNSDHWTYSDHDQAYQSMQVLLQEEFPFLTDRSVVRIATSAAWGWR